MMYSSGSFNDAWVAMTVSAGVARRGRDSMYARESAVSTLVVQARDS